MKEKNQGLSRTLCINPKEQSPDENKDLQPGREKTQTTFPINV